MPASCVAALHRPEVQAKRLAALRAALAARPKQHKPDRPKYGSQEWKDKIGAANKGKKRNAEQRKAMSLRKASAETRRKNSDSKRAWWAALPDADRAAFLAKRGSGVSAWWQAASLEARDKRTAATADGRARGTAAYVRKVAEMPRDVLRNHMRPAWDAEKPEMTSAHRSALRRGQAEWIKRFWARMTPAERKAHCATGIAALIAKWKQTDKAARIARTANGRRAAQLANPSSLEVTVAALLTSLGVEFRQQHQIDRFTVDFYVPTRSLVIECDGYYWHNLPGAPEKDARRDEWLCSHGYSVIRLSERDIKAGLVLQRLKEIA